MSNYSTYTNLDVWKKARFLTCEIYKLTAKFPREELYGLGAQMRRAAVSIASNIAEGCGRQYKKETIQFQYLSRGSQYELETQLYLALDLGFVDEVEMKRILEVLIDCRKLLSGFINYLQKADLK
jgi:four helix bundle protein